MSFRLSGGNRHGGGGGGHGGHKRNGGGGGGNKGGNNHNYDSSYRVRQFAEMMLRLYMFAETLPHNLLE